MSLSIFVEAEFPVMFQTGTPYDNIKREHLDIIGNHVLTEILFLKAQRPTPIPTPVIPKTFPGMNLNEILKQLDSSVKKYNDMPNVFPKMQTNPYRDVRYLSAHLLIAFISIFEIYESGLIAYYAAPFPSPPPPGYPTTPIPKPFPAPIITVPTLEEETCKQYLINNVRGKSSHAPDVNNNMERYIGAWTKFLLTEVFL